MSPWDRPLAMRSPVPLHISSMLRPCEFGSPVSWLLRRARVGPGLSSVWSSPAMITSGKSGSTRVRAFWSPTTKTWPRSSAHWTHAVSASQTPLDAVLIPLSAIGTI